MAVFEESYFQGELREGFYIENMMKRTWAAQIDVLEKVGEICDKYGLRYFADSGTLLGAVRHKGYIPWDDDIDIAMFREDYEKFVAIADKELPEGYCVYDARTSDGWSGAISRVVNGSQIGYANSELMKRNHGCPYIVGIDIFVLDELPVEKELEEIQWDLLVSIMLIKFEVLEKKTIDEELEQRLLRMEELCNVKLSRGKNLANELLDLSDTICCLYNQGNSEEITNLYWYINHRDYRFQKAWYRDSMRIPFENIMIPVPIDYDKILRVTYGADYMTPKQVSAGHDYPHYKSQQQQWEWYEVRMVLKAVLGACEQKISDIETVNEGNQISAYAAIYRGVKYRVSVPRAGESEAITENILLGEVSEIEEVLYINAEKGYCVERYRATNIG